MGWSSICFLSLKTLLRLLFLLLCLIYFPFIFSASITSVFFLNFPHQRLPETLPIVLKDIKHLCGRDAKLDRTAFLKTFKNFKSYPSCWNKNMGLINIFHAKVVSIHFFFQGSQCLEFIRFPKRPMTQKRLKRCLSNLVSRVILGLLCSNHQPLCQISQYIRYFVFQPK